MHQTALTAAAPRSTGRSPLVIWLPRIAIILLVAICGFFAVRAGIRFRHWMWDTSEPIRFVADINRGYHWGRRCAVEGYLNQYDKMQPQQPADDNWLDYAPLRLGVMALWGKWSLSHFPKVRYWQQDESYAFTAPVLDFNLFMEAIGLVSAFFLARLWAIRNSPADQIDRAGLRFFFRGWIPGLIAVLLLWFNPAIVLSAYGWPTWDLWIIPLFLLAALMASLDCWFTAGVVIGIGAMFKGQQLLAIPIFFIWSLMLPWRLNSLKFLGGATLAVALVASPWLLTYIPADQLDRAREIQSEYGQAYRVPIGTFQLPRAFDLPALIWVIGILLCAAGLPWVKWLQFKSSSIPRRWERWLASAWTWRAAAAGVAFLWVMLPWMLKRNRNEWEWGALLAILLAGAILLVRSRGIAFLAATALGVALLLCMSIFHGSSAWYDCGWRFGTTHWPRMVMGMTDNLPGILVADFNWPYDDLSSAVFTLPAHLLYHYPAAKVNVSMRAFLMGLFWINLIPCCLGLGMHARRRDGRVLIALTAPWLIFFCFPPQIHERYLLFAAGISSVCVAESAGMALLGVLLSLITFLMTLNVMLDNASESLRIQLGANLAKQFPSIFRESSGEKLRSLVNGTHPDLGYAVILCAMIFLYFSLAPRRRPALISHKRKLV